MNVEDPSPLDCSKAIIFYEKEKYDIFIFSCGLRFVFPILLDMKLLYDITYQLNITYLIYKLVITFIT